MVVKNKCLLSTSAVQTAVVDLQDPSTTPQAFSPPREDQGKNPWTLHRCSSASEPQNHA